MKYHQKHRTLKQKTLFIVVAIIIVGSAVIALKYGVVSAANNSAKTSITTASSKLTSLTSDINSTTASSGDTNDQKVAKFQRYASDIKTLADTICHDQRSTIYYDILPAHGSCEKARSALLELAMSASATYSYVADETVLASLLPKGNTTRSFSDMYDLWNRTSSLINAAKVGQEATGIKASLQKAVDSYRDAWKAVVDADSKRDSSAFSKATDAVKAAYVTLQSQTNISKAQLDSLDASFSSKYAAFTVATKA